MTVIKSIKDVKSVHIKECWPFEYVAPKRRVFTRESMDKFNAQKREVYIRKKAATIKTLEGKKLLSLPVYEMSDSLCERLNYESQSRF